MKLILTAVLSMMVLGCASGETYFRLEEYGEGWKLNVVEEEETFRASWVAGENRSARLVNYYDDKGSDYYILNTLYLELDDAGQVVEGRLKRVVLPEFEQRSYYEQKAQWFRVLEGTCVLNERLEGTLDVRCEGGYVFIGEVRPLDDLEVVKPE